jgi:hypothetical protein
MRTFPERRLLIAGRFERATDHGGHQIKLGEAGKRPTEDSSSVAHHRYPVANDIEFLQFVTNKDNRDS